MQKLLAILSVAFVLAVGAVAPAIANDDPLFVNMTTDDPHRAKMAIVFSRKQQERKHPVTIFLNDKGVLVGSKSKSQEFKGHQETLAAIMKDFGNVVACPMCMEHYGVKKADLLDGIQVGSPELTGRLLFEDDDTKTLSW